MLISNKKPLRPQLPFVSSSTHFVISSKCITILLGMILLLGTHAEKGYKFIFYGKVHHMIPTDVKLTGI